MLVFFIPMVFLNPFLRLLESQNEALLFLLAIAVRPIVLCAIFLNPHSLYVSGFGFGFFGVLVFCFWFVFFSHELLFCFHANFRCHSLEF